MSFQSWLDALSTRTQPRRSRRSRRSAASRRPEQRRLLVEGFEDRRLLTFVPAVDYPVGTNPQAVVAADFNNDTLEDLAFANYTSRDVSVLLANPDGTFQPALTAATGSPLPTQSLAVGDFNNDGILDLATGQGLDYGYPFNDDVSVLLGINDGTNKGTGNFQVPIGTYNIGIRPESMAAGDFNGDGLLDLGVTSYYYGDSGSAQVLLGNGAGGFSEINTTWLGYGFHSSTAVADFNADGIDDFATASVSNGTVSVLLGNTSGYLKGPSEFSAGTYSYAVAAADVNGDNHIDLVTADFYDDYVSVLLGDGLGGFGGPVHYAAGGSAGRIVLRDFTGDGHLDVATTNYYSDSVCVLYGMGDGTFAGPTFVAVGSSPWAIAAGDFNGDTWLDIATANNYGNNASVLINDRSWPNPPSVLPLIAISDAATVTEGDGGTVSAVFTVTRSGDLAGTSIVNYSTANGGALAGSDYVAASGTVIFGPGETTQTITILVNGDTVDEYDETFSVNLSVPNGAAILDSQGAGTIVDNDAPPDVTISDQSRNEGGRYNSTFVFTVTLSEASGKGLYVYYATADGTATVAGGDYFAKSSYVYIAPGETTGTLTVTVRADKTPEFDETFAVKLTAATDGAGGTGGTIVDDEGIGTIVNDDRGSGKGGGKANANKVGSAGLIAALLAEGDLTTARKRK